MKKENKYISDCCGAEIVPQCADEGTCHAHCAKCGKNCNWKPCEIESENKSWERGGRDTKVCENGHIMTGIGFDECCPECEGKWIEQKCPFLCRELPECDVCLKAGCKHKLETSQPPKTNNDMSKTSDQIIESKRLETSDIRNICGENECDCPKNCECKGGYWKCHSHD